MSKTSLKSMLARSPEIRRRLEQDLLYGSARFWLEDIDGQKLFGVQHGQNPGRYPVQADGALLGYVYSSDDAAFIADWLSLWAGQELEKKKLGAEVLHLYREINLIFNFSGLLASAVGIDAIAQLAIREAGHLIPFQQGAVVFLKEPDAPAEVFARTGDTGFPAPKQLQADGFYRQISGSGASEILRLPAAEAGENEEKWLMYASLKVRHHILGAMFLLRNGGPEFTAAELKLLTTLAVQSAAAMESSLLYEKATQKALRQQREKLMFDLALKNPFFKKVMAVIESNIGDPDFNVERLSRAVNLSPSQLQRKVMALAARPPLQVIRDLRLQKAKDLLRHSDLSIAEIAWQTGFNDPSYFTRLFTREMHKTPSDWKLDPPKE